MQKLNQITFDISLIDFAPLYFHFLDGHLNSKFGSKIKIINNLIINYNFIDINDETDKIVFLKIKENSLSFSNFRNENINFSFDEIIKNINDETYIDKIFDRLNYCLYNVGLDKHATTILFELKDDSIIISFFNSGEGILYNGSPSGSYFKPFKSFIIDISNKLECFKKIISIILIPVYYKLVTLIIYDKKRKITINGIHEKMVGNNYKIFKKLIELSKFLKGINLNIDLNDIIKYEFKYNGISYNINNIYDYPNEEYFNNSFNNLSSTAKNNKVIKQNFYLYDIDSLIFETKDSYYKIILDYITDTFLLSEKNDYNFTVFFQNSMNFDFINKNIRDKIIFINKGNDIYIKPQENGSCTWFSIYWPLLYFYITNNNPNKYYGMIKKIYETFSEMLKNIFKQENFINTKDLLLKKVLYSKFYNLGFINEELSIENINSIYSIHSFKYEKMKIDNNYTVNKLYSFDNTFLNIFIEKSYDNIEVFTFIDLYNYYQYDKVFNKEKPDISISSTLFTEYDELLLNFQESYDIDNTFYINNFISYSLYVNNIYYKYNFEDDNELINFCKYLYRYDIFIKICNKIYEKSIELFKNIDRFQEETQKIYDYILPIIFNEKNRYFNFNNYYIKNTIGGLKFKLEYIKKIFDITSGCKYNINHFIDIDFNDNNKKYFKKYKRTIDYYKKLREYLYENPKYIYQDFNYNEYEIGEDYFILLNIHDIFKKEEFRNNLIKFYANIFFEKYKSNNTFTKELFWITFNLQLLITKYTSGLKRNEKYYNNFDPNINKFIIETSIISINEFYKKIIEIINNKEKNQFIEYLIKNKDIIIKTVEIILKKHFKTISFDYENNTINIDDKTFIYIKYIHVDTTDLSLMINKDNILLLEINNKELLIVDDNNYIKLIIEPNIEPSKTENSNRKYIKVKIKIRYVDNSITTKFKINEILYNNNPIINYADLNEPFKYTIPMNCFNIIYKINGIYHITYFCNNINNSLILGESSLSGQYTITINKNNLIYPDNKSYKSFYNLCINFDINHLNILYCNFKNETTYLLLNDKYFNSFNFNKNQLLIEELKKENYLKINLIFPEITNIFDFKTKEFTLISDKLRDSYVEEIISTIGKVKKSINNFFIFIRGNKNIKTIFDNYSIIYNYLISLKVLNTCNILIELLDIKYKKSNYIEFCSQLKIFNDYFNVKKHSFKYKFEAIFELICGNELLDEQMERYNNIVNSYIDYIKNKGAPDKKYDLVPKLYEDEINIINQSGGHIYPLHHIMMGKGKSSILTPILSLYFSLICNKEPIIIVPEHLLIDTQEIINEYVHVFNIGNIQILSDDIAKGYFLENEFKSNDNSIMIIDEFDYLIDPLKSNFNITINKNKSIMEVFNMLVPPDILENIEEHQNFLINIRQNDKINDLFYNDYLIDDIDNIIKDIRDGKLVENIKWGIHPRKFYAIPYKNKDTPLLTSNFSSFIITIYLTLYYYIIIHNYDITDTVVNCIIEFKLFTEIFDTEEPVILTKEYIKELSQNENFKINTLFKILFKNIFEGIKIAEYQYNTSFIDLINIDNLFKIGYSGTLNILPLNLKTIDKFDIVSMEDRDEEQNIKFAIENKDTVIIQFIDLDNLYIIINNYDAIIDCIGLLKDYQNQEIAIKIFLLFNKKRNIIFIDENNKKYVIIKDTENKIDLYNSNIYYENPFIYFDQGHILGIDIKQDMYPIMKGLCIIGKNSIYSEVAQGMYRLRKLNMGHSIDFLYYDELGKINNKSLLKKLKDRENINNENKKINLEYQIIKSDLRKNRDKTEINKLYISEEYTNFKNPKYDIRYFEKVKYYTSEEIDVKDINNIFKNIFYDTELSQLSENIKKNILKLVYNLNSYNSDHVTEIEKLTLKEVEKSYDKVSNLITFKKEDIIEFEYIDYSLINETKIEYDNFIDYLPNIFTQVNGIDFSNNKSGYLFVYKNNKILIIPGYLIIYYEKYPLFNYKLNYINNKKIDDKILKKLKELDFFKVLYNKNENVIESINYVLYKILSDKKTLFNYQIELIKKYKSINTDIIKIKQSLVQFQDLNISRIKNNLFSKKYIKINNNYFKKYLIYKKKYLKLKLNKITNG